jgi:hypothetical protein
MMDPEPFWVISKWKAAELDGETIEFRLPLEGGVAHGIGPIQARAREIVDHRVAITILVERPLSQWGRQILEFRLSQIDSDRIEEHPNQEIARFQLLRA